MQHGTINPLRYRGYVYDHETGLYYLQSHYYSPKVGRFINADALVSTGQGLLGNNMFAYCGNNPVVRADYVGTAYTRSQYKANLSRPIIFSEYVPQDIDCYNYALGLNGSNNPGDYSYADGSGKMYANGVKVHSVEEVANLAIRDIKNYLGRDAYIIAHPSDVPDGYYVIAVKTSSIISDNIGVADYHFAVMIDDYFWADKQGKSDKARCGVIFPTHALWDKQDAPGYYNSPTIYIAVEGRWTPTW